MQIWTPELSPAWTFLPLIFSSGWLGEVGAPYDAQVYRNVSPQGSVGRINYKASSGSLQIKAQSTGKPALPAAQSEPHSAATVQFPGEVAGLGGTCTGRATFECGSVTCPPRGRGQYPLHRL